MTAEAKDVLALAWPPLRAILVPNVVPVVVSTNVTAPVGAVGPAAETVAVNVTDWPTALLICDEASATTGVA